MSTNQTTAFPEGYAEEDISNSVLVVACVFIVLEVLIVGMRLMTRLKYQSKLGLDDYLILPALVCGLGMCAVAIVEIKLAGVGRHLAVLIATDLTAVQNWAKCAYAMETTYCAAIALPKLSILASYLRIFTTKPYRWATYAIGAIVSATAIAGIIASFSMCDTFAGRWDLLKFPGNCRDIVSYWKGMSVPNIVTDAVMLFLPLPVIWNLQIQTKQKIALIFIFALGSLGMVSSIIRLKVAFRMTGLEDGTWDTAELVIWSCVEAGCYLIAACLPTLRPLFLSAVNTAKDTVGYSSKKLGVSSGRSNDSHQLASLQGRYEEHNSSQYQMLEEGTHHHVSVQAGRGPHQKYSSNLPV
ncbi:unnamed protein product [Clonostachys rosea]|uniref:Rhodopsin domain-containing protein n=1 Tax=Bionectria ochroleuca TaxID=29856 RepID=A0ABY6TZZ7_BIOOC|nr:unnamed protein product [Clonostachys rosea]